MDSNSNIEKLSKEQKKNIARVCWGCNKMKPNLKTCTECKVATYCDIKCKEKDIGHVLKCKDAIGGITKEKMDILFFRFMTMNASRAILKALKLFALESQTCVVIQIRPVVSGEGILIDYRLSAQKAPSVDGLRMRIDFIYQNHTITKINDIGTSWGEEDTKNMQQIVKDKNYLFNEGVFMWKDEYILNPLDIGVCYERNRRIHLNEIKPIEFIIGSIIREDGLSHFESIRVEHVQVRNV